MTVSHRIPVQVSPAYTVTVGEGLLAHSGEWLRGLCAPQKAALVTDDRVAALYGEAVTASLTAAGFSVCSFVFKNGEAQKTPETLLALTAFLSENAFSHGDIVVALGGGVPGDVAGFAAAVYLRGLPFVQMPTTLLSAVDASVGGKTGVDLPKGKNLIGAFHQPLGVLCDTDTFRTLPEAERRGGMAEVVKTAVLGDAGLVSLLEQGAATDAELVARCVAVKAALVERDERDTGERRLLNLGHTVGHAVEVCSHFTLPHGYAVAAGMAVVARAAARRGWCGGETAGRLIALLKQYGLPTDAPYSDDQLAAAALSDKKRAGERLPLAVPAAIGHAVLREIPVTDLCSLIRDGREETA